MYQLDADNGKLGVLGGETLNHKGEEAVGKRIVTPFVLVTLCLASTLLPPHNHEPLLYAWLDVTLGFGHSLLDTVFSSAGCGLCFGLPFHTSPCSLATSPNGTAMWGEHKCYATFFLKCEKMELRSKALKSGVSLDRSLTTKNECATPCHGVSVRKGAYEPFPLCRVAWRKSIQNPHGGVCPILDNEEPLSCPYQLPCILILRTGGCVCVRK